MIFSFFCTREMDVFNYAYILDCVEKETLLPNLLEYRCVIGSTLGTSDFDKIS
jgi:hypothetical protein